MILVVKTPLFAQKNLTIHGKIHHMSHLKNYLKSIYRRFSRSYRQQAYILDLQRQINDLHNQLHEYNKKFSTYHQEIQSLQNQLSQYQQMTEEKFTKSNEKIDYNNKSLTYKLHRYCPDDKRALALQDWYFEKTGEILNLENPQTFNEKIQWLKLYDNSPLKSQLGDKLKVRDWVTKKIGAKYLVPLLGVWKAFGEINFATLPKQFVLKCNHGSGYNIIVNDKDKLDLEQAKKTIDFWLQQNYTFKEGLELYYENIKPMIIAEEYLENSTNDLYDYKFWCFNGKVEYIQFLSNRYLNGGLKMAFYDRQWNKQDFVYSYPLDDKNILKPSNLNEMIKLAEKLATGFIHVRVDFYRLNDGKIYFGEMTFASMSGTCEWIPTSANKTMGSLIKLNANKLKH